MVFTFSLPEGGRIAPLLPRQLRHWSSAFRTRTATSSFAWFTRNNRYNSATIGRFLHPYEIHLPFTPVLTTRIITALQLLNVIVAFLSRRRRPALQALSLLISYNTIHTTQCSECRNFQWLRTVLLKSESGRRPNIAFITKILRICCRKKWNSSIFLHRNLFQRKKAKKEPKGQTNFLRPTNLKRGQISEIWPKKGQSGNPVYNTWIGQTVTAEWKTASVFEAVSSTVWILQTRLYCYFWSASPKYTGSVFSCMQPSGNANQP